MCLGGVALDLFSSDDNEALGWLRMIGFAFKTLFVCGDSVDLVFDSTRYPTVSWMHVSDFDVKTIDAYQLIIVVPAFFSNRNEMYHTLSRIIDLFTTRARIGWKKTAMVGVRESMELLNSRWIGAGLKDRTAAEQDFIRINAQAEHNGGGLAIDSLRPMSIVNHVRELADYVVIKRLGRIKVPPELEYVFKFVRWKWARRMPLKDFIVYTDSDDIFYGDCDPFDWHVKRGEAMLTNMGIGIVINEKKSTEKKEKSRSDEYMENHRKIMAEYEQDPNESHVASKLGMNRGTVIRHVSDHKSGSCKCGA